MQHRVKKKVLYLATLAERGGAQRYVRDLASSLDPNGFSVAVAAGEGGSLQHFCQERGILFTALRHLRRDISPWHDLLAIGEIARLIKQLQPDILHLNSSKAGVLGTLAAWRARSVKIVYTAHGFVFGEPLRVLLRWFYRWAERLTAARKDVILCVSEADRQLALRYRITPPEKLVTIHNGIDADGINFLPTADAKTRLRQRFRHPSSDDPTRSSDDGWIGTIANLYPTKGVANLIAALPEVLRRFPGTHLVVMGDGPERKILERQIQTLRIVSSCHLVGEVADAARLLPALDVYVSSSLKEGFPYAILEAMAARRPIVATAVGGLPEMIRSGEEGLLVPAGQPAELASAIIQLLENHALAQQLGEAAGKRVRQEFTLNKMVEQTLVRYRQLLAQPN